MDERPDPAEHYIVLAEPSAEGGYLAWCPDVPAYTATADSPTSALVAWQDGLDDHLAQLDRTNRAAPEPRIHAIGMVRP